VFIFKLVSKTSTSNVRQALEPSATTFNPRWATGRKTGCRTFNRSDKRNGKKIRSSRSSLGRYLSTQNRHAGSPRQWRLATTGHFYVPLVPRGQGQQIRCYRRRNLYRRYGIW